MEDKRSICRDGYFTWNKNVVKVDNSVHWSTNFMLAASEGNIVFWTSRHWQNNACKNSSYRIRCTIYQHSYSIIASNVWSIKMTIDYSMWYPVKAGHLSSFSVAWGWKEICEGRFLFGSKAYPSIIFIDEVCRQAIKSIIIIHSFSALWLMLTFLLFFYRLTVCLEGDEILESTKPCERWKMNLWYIGMDWVLKKKNVYLVLAATNRPFDLGSASIFPWTWQIEGFSLTLSCWFFLLAD